MVKKPKRLGLVNFSQSNEHNSELYQTEDPNIKCTRLPDFLRAKKRLGAPFCVYVTNNHVQEGTKVVLVAGNYKNPTAELKNNTSHISNGVAQFDDLRFIVSYCLYFISFKSFKN